MDDRPGLGRLLLELEEVAVQVASGAILDRLPGQPQLLPLGQLLHPLGPLVTDRPGGVAEVAAQLLVAQLRPGVG